MALESLFELEKQPDGDIIQKSKIRRRDSPASSSEDDAHLSDAELVVKYMLEAERLARVSAEIARVSMELGRLSSEQVTHADAKSRMRKLLAQRGFDPKTLTPGLFDPQTMNAELFGQHFENDASDGEEVGSPAQEVSLSLPPHELLDGAPHLTLVDEAA